MSKLNNEGKCHNIPYNSNMQWTLARDFLKMRLGRRNHRLDFSHFLSHLFFIRVRFSGQDDKHTLFVQF